MESQSSERGARARFLVILIAVFAVVYLPWLSVEPPVAGLETTRILVTREMMRTGNWIVPTQNGLTYLAKPPVGYWLIALGSLPFGAVGVVSARLVSAMCILGLALVVAAFAKRELGARIGLLAGLCVLGTGLSLQNGIHGELDAPFALFTALAILSAFRSTWSERRSWWWCLGAGLSLGAATLTKGPLALLLFLLAIGGLAIGSRTRRRRAVVFGSVAFVTGVLVGGAWLLALRWHGAGPAEFQRLVDEAFKRVYDAGKTNREAWWYYGPALLVALLPVSLLFPALLARASQAMPEEDRERGLFAALVGWSVASLVLMSLSEGKEARYLMPLVPGWSLLGAWAWFRAEDVSWVRAWRNLLIRAGIALAWILPAGLALAGWWIWPNAVTGIVTAVAFATVAAVVLALGRRRQRTSLMWSALLLELLALRVFWAEVPMAVRNAQYPIESMGRQIAARLSPGEPLVQLGEFSSSVQLQVDHPFRLAPTLSDVPSALAREPTTQFVLARTRFLPLGEEQAWIEIAEWSFGSDSFRLMKVP